MPVKAQQLRPSIRVARNMAGFSPRMGKIRPIGVGRYEELQEELVNPSPIPQLIPHFPLHFVTKILAAALSK